MGPESMLASKRGFGVLRLFGQQRDDLARRNAPVIAQGVGDRAFQQEAVGKQLVLRHARQTDVLDRVAEGPMAQVVQQGRRDQPLGIPALHQSGEPIVMRQLLQIQQRQAIHAQANARTACDAPRDRPGPPAPTG